MLAVFHLTVRVGMNQKEAYNFKEIEKFSMKQSIPLPVVKDVLDSLVGDDLVIVEKIGAGNYFWSFPSQTYQTVPSYHRGGQ